jgi:hypothetical protein
VLRVAYAAVAGERLKDAVQRLVEALAPARSALPLV